MTKEEMTLNKWLRDNNISIFTLAKHLGCSIYAIRKWLRKERIPRPEMQARIKKLTAGAVDGNVWIEIARK